MTDIYVLLTGVLVKEKSVHDLPDIPIPEDQFEKIKFKYNTAKDLQEPYSKNTIAI